MEWKLVGFKLVIAVFTVVILIIAVTSIYPPLTGGLDIQIPDENDVTWSLRDDSIYVEGNMWINNTGYYDLKDIKIDLRIDGLERELFEYSENIDNIAVGENRKITLSLQKNIHDFSESDLETLVFNRTDFNVEADMTAEYPFSILGFTLDYNTAIEWEGVVEDMNYYEDQVALSGNATGSTIEIPFELITTTQIDGNSSVDVTLQNDDRTQNYSSDHLFIELGGTQDDVVTFHLDESETEEFIFESQEVVIVSKIMLSDFDYNIDHVTTYQWEAPVKEIDFKYAQSSVRETPGGSELVLPFEVSTSDRLDGDAFVDVVMQNDEESTQYSSYQFTLPLGVDNYTENLIFPLNDSETENFITHSQEVKFDSNVNLMQEDIDFVYEESYYWGAPLNDLSVDNIQYDLINSEAEVTYSFINDSPRRLDLNLDITVYDSSDNVIGMKYITYLNNSEYSISSGETFTDTITISVSGDPSYADVDFNDENSGMEFEKVVYR